MKNQRRSLAFTLVVVSGGLDGACTESGIALESGAPAPELIVRAVSDDSYDIPIQNVRIQIDDGPWVTTDASGTARFANVSGPYSIRAVHTYLSGADDQDRVTNVWIRHDLTDNPLRFLIDAPSVFERGCALSGRVLDRTASDSQLLIFGPGVVADSDPIGNEFAAIMPRRPNPTLLRVFEQQSNAIVGYGQQTVTLSAGQRCTDGGVDIGLRPVPRRSSTVSVRVPTALPTRQLFVSSGLDFGPGLFTVDVDRASRGDRSTFVLETVEVADGESFVAAHTDTTSVGFASTRVDLGPRRVLDITLSTPVELTAPADDARIDLGAPFQWMPSPNTMADALYEWRAFCASERSTGGTRYIRYRAVETSETEIEIPVIAGVRLTRGTTCTWLVVKVERPDEDTTRLASTNTRVFRL